MSGSGVLSANDATFLLPQNAYRAEYTFGVQRIVYTHQYRELNCYPNVFCSLLNAGKNRKEQRSWTKKIFFAKYDFTLANKVEGSVARVR